MPLTPKEQKQFERLLAKKEKPVKIKKDVLARIEEKLGKDGGCVLVVDVHGSVIVYGIDAYQRNVEHGRKLGKGELKKKVPGEGQLVLTQP